MLKTFNTEGQCIPQLHYMVNLEERLAKIKKLVDAGKYFTINRARQYGKTTTLTALTQYLSADYSIISLDFQGMSSAKFQNEQTFSEAFADVFTDERNWFGPKKNDRELRQLATLKKAAEEEKESFDLVELFCHIEKICAVASKPLVLMIDEVDSATNNQVFLDFLAQLRMGYINRGKMAAFYSVILAGVYDVKNLKLKLRPDAEHRFNSPWNIREGNEENASLLAFDDCTRCHRECIPYDIAAKFNVDMSFSVKDIAGMLQQYEQEMQTGMDIRKIAGIIFDYTSGYPFLVSAICKTMDEELSSQPRFTDKASIWTQSGVAEAVKVILKEPASLFENMMKQMNHFPELRRMLSEIIYQGRMFPYNPLNEVIQIGSMFGFLKDADGVVAVSNRIFEMALLNLFISEESAKSEAYQAGARDKNQFIQNGRLNMELVLEKFVRHYTDVFADSDEKFLEEKGRKIFLMYLKPIINGVGNSYLEAATRDMERTDVIVDYLGEQYIIEMKIWRGNAYHERGEEQICGYLDTYHQKKGYMVSFNFNKNKTAGVHKMQIGDKVIVEAVV